MPNLSRASGFERPQPDKFRIAHLTDIHVEATQTAMNGFESCLSHVQGQKILPDLILNGGDAVMETLEADESSAAKQWDAFKRVMKANNSVPVEHLLGNHDVWGWGDRKKHYMKQGFGKQLAMDELELKRPYKSLNVAGWHIVLLDSTHPKTGDGYVARLDDIQFAWLREDLAAVPKDTPVMIASHIPILCACAFLDGKNEATGKWIVPGEWMHIDSRRIVDLFSKHPNVRLCVSGHIHLADEVTYNGVKYCCNGAVSGNWWKGAYQQTKRGYGWIELGSDGSFTNSYIAY